MIRYQQQTQTVTTLHCTVLHCHAMQCTSMHCTACTALHCTALWCTALYCAAVHLLYCSELFRLHFHIALFCRCCCQKITRPHFKNQSVPSVSSMIHSAITVWQYTLSSTICLLDSFCKIALGLDPLAWLLHYKQRKYLFTTLEGLAWSRQCF